MIYFFDIPQVQDKEVISKCFVGKEFTEEDKAFLHQTDQSRSYFYSLFSFEKIQKLLELQDSLLNYESTFQLYLKNTVLMLEMLAKKQGQKLKFRYSTFLSKNQVFYETNDSLSNLESCGVEVLLSRYAYCFSYQLMPVNLIKIFLDLTTQSLKEQEKFTQQNELKKIIEGILQLWGQGYIQIAKIQELSKNILYFLVKKEGNLVTECKSTVLYSIRKILIINANSLYIEELRQDKDYESMSMLCKVSLQQMIEVNMRLRELQSEVKEELLQYSEMSIIFYKAYLAWSLIKIQQIIISNEQFQKKTFTQISQECLSIAHEIQKLSNKYRSLSNDTDFYGYGMLFFTNLFDPLSKQIIQQYTGIYKSEFILPNGDELFSQVKEGVNYYDTNKNVVQQVKIQ